MAGRKKSVSVQEELLLCPSAKPGDWFPGIPVSAVAGIDEAGRGCLAAGTMDADLTEGVPQRSGPPYL